MRIRMLKTENGSVDGIRVFSYEKDSEHVLAGTDGERSLAAAFVGAGMALNLDDDSKGAGDRDEFPAPVHPEPESAAAAKPGRARKQ